jgi:protein gp37
MNNTKIDWADMTWNSVTGCLHGCEYCYARKIANRFAGGGYGKENGMFIAKYKDDAFKQPYELNEPQMAKTKDDWYRDAPYPFGFDPTFHRYRLDEPKKIKKPQRIFVCSMADLFGEWVPDTWIDEVFTACKNAPQHKYMFLTKNPYRYMQLHIRGRLPQDQNLWYGTTITESGKIPFNCLDFTHNFISVEPIMGQMSERFPFTNVQWVIIGAETGNRKGKVVPKRQWVMDILTACKDSNVPIFMKESLRDLMGDDFVQEFPDGLKGVQG